jgi:hypothetical protein
MRLCSGDQVISNQTKALAKRKNNLFIDEPKKNPYAKAKYASSL